MKWKLLWQGCLLFGALQGTNAWAEHDEAAAAEPDEAPATSRPEASEDKKEQHLEKILPTLVDKKLFSEALEKGTPPSSDLFKGNARWKGGCVSGDYNYGPDGKLKGQYTDGGSYWYHGANLRSFEKDRSGKNGLDLDLTDGGGLWTPWISTVGSARSLNRDLQTPVVASSDDHGIFFKQQARGYGGEGQTQVVLRQTTASDGTPMLIAQENLLSSQGLHYPKYCVFVPKGIPRAQDVPWETRGH